ncbi:hypothetical protein FRC09_008319 [Ceratobasidium sp. 395]|nr:hypothetical protein FRC09_008319 [Ceratobasidium sp. 395]
MRNHQEAPLEETQTDSQLSVEGEGVIALVDLPDTLGSFPRNDTVSSMPLEDSQRNEILIAAVKFLTNLSKEEAKVGIAAEEHPGIGARVTIISWVDDFLVKLCACILHLATNGAMQDFNKRAGTGSVGSLQNNEARKAATQLPSK